jgi:hypothetical protein
LANKGDPILQLLGKKTNAFLQEAAGYEPKELVE